MLSAFLLGSRQLAGIIELIRAIDGRAFLGLFTEALGLGQIEFFLELGIPLDGPGMPISPVLYVTAQLAHLTTQIGKPTNKHRRSDTGVMVEKSLNDILESDPDVTSFLGDDFVFYLRMFLCDPRGQNVRNKSAHGLMEPEHFHRGLSDRLLHIMWSLAFVRENSGEEGDAE